MKVLLSIILMATSFSVFAVSQCSHGQKQIVKIANATVTEGAKASVEGKSIPLSYAAEMMSPGQTFKGVVVKVCYDVGHIPGVMSYWKEFIIPESEILESI